MRSAYNFLVMASRYWFIALALLISYRLARYSLTDIYGQKSRREKQGRIGQLVWLQRGQAENPVVTMPLMKESLIGSSSRCDVRIQAPSVRGQHAMITMLDGQPMIKPVGDAPLLVSGHAYAGTPISLMSGQTIQIGDVPLVIQLDKQSVQEDMHVPG